MPWGNRNSGSSGRKDWRNLLYRLRVPVAVALVIAAFAMLLSDWVEETRQSERQEAVNWMSGFLSRAGDIQADYLRQRQREIASARKALDIKAAEIAGQVQVRLLEAISARQDRIAREKQLAVQAAKQRAEEIARQQNDLLSQYRNAIKQLKEKIESEGARKGSLLRSRSNETNELDTLIELDEIEGPEIADTVGKPLVKKAAVSDASSKPVFDDKEPVQAALLPPLPVEAEFPGADNEGTIAGFDPAREDWPEHLLLGCGTDLKNMLPEGAVLLIRKTGGESILRLGGDKPAADKAVGKAERDLVFKAGEVGREWTVSVELVAEIFPLEPSAGELARVLAASLDPEKWGEGNVRCLLTDSDHRVVEVFPKNAPGPDLMPLVERGAWQDVGGGDGLITRLETVRPDNVNLWGVGVQVSVLDPEVGSRMAAALGDDWRLAAALAATIIGFVVLTYYSLSISVTSALVEVSKERPSSNKKPAPKANPDDLVRLVRSGPRAVPEDASLIVAEVGSGDGESKVSVKALPRRKAGHCNLLKLQALHRGTANGSSSRILDYARSPVLKELAKRVRPGGGPAARGNVTDTDDSSAREDVLQSLHKEIAARGGRKADV